MSVCPKGWMVGGRGRGESEASPEPNARWPAGSHACHAPSLEDLPPGLGAGTCSGAACRGLAPLGVGGIEAGILGKPVSPCPRSVTAGWWEHRVCPLCLVCWEQGWRAVGGCGDTSVSSQTSVQPGSRQSGAAAPAPGSGSSSRGAPGEVPAGWMASLDARLLLREGSLVVCTSD